MKKISMIIFAVALFATANSQTNKPKPMTAADSAAVQQAETNKFIDSTRSKVTIKEFSDWLDDNVSGKFMREGTFTALWTTFIQAKYNEWMQRRQKRN